MAVPRAPGTHPLAYPHHRGLDLLLCPIVAAPLAGSVVDHCPLTALDLQGALVEALGHLGALMSAFIGEIYPGLEHSWALKIQRKGKMEKKQKWADLRVKRKEKLREMS